ncbi:glutaredoxin 3 [Hyalangium rubrum]|uniref:Glutaredoxin n=1 Tax=Hyalangium rubrum TaxID=3103134 RepID=A0ABU5H3P3_9BACT|nr:glutaredoxin 3 [Hyalangium sp. s54d21]MDY7228096.1 glutaredoxin 3 [Hyalangium sp. s54d21]
MPDILMYSKPTCPYCHRAMALFRSKGVSVKTVDISAHPERRKKMIERSGRTTVPEIFINGRFIGGCDDLYALDARGGLDPLLQDEQPAPTP